MQSTTAVDEETSNQRAHVSSGIALAVLGTFLFALKSIFIKLAFAAGADPTSLLTLRMSFSLPFYLAVLAYVATDKRNATSRLSTGVVVRSLALGFAGYYLASYLDLAGLAYISAQLERLTLFTYPVLISVLAWAFLGESFTRRTGAALLLCYAGVATMYLGEQTFATGANVRKGVLLVMGSSVSYSIYVLFAKPTIQSIGSLAFTSLAMIGSTFFVAVHYACVHPIDVIFTFDTTIYYYALILAFVCTVIPSFMISEAIARIGASRTSIIGTLGPVVTMGLAIVILGEPSSWRHAVGMVLAVAGVRLVASAGR